MAKDKNVVTIDFNVYCTQAEYARLKGIKPGTVNQWVLRAKEGIGKAKVAIMEVPQLNITLVAK